MSKNIQKRKKVTAENNSTSFYSSFLKYPYIFILIIAIAVNAQTLTFDFVEHDDNLVTLDYKYFSNLSNVGSAFSHTYLNSNYYRPMVTVSMIIDTCIGKGEPFMYHLTNLLFHLLACCLIFKLLTLLGFNRTLALMSAMFFAVNPLTSNSINWIPGRNDSILLVFSLFSFNALINHLNHQKTICFFIHIITLFAAFLSKETALVLPFIFMFFIIFFKKSDVRKNIISLLLASWVVLWIVWFLIRANISEPIFKGNFDFATIFYGLRIIPEAIAKFLIPFNISVLAYYNTISLIIGLIAIIAVIYLSFKKIGQNGNTFWLGFIWLILGILPSIVSPTATQSGYYDYLETRLYFVLPAFFMILKSIIPEQYYSMKRLNIMLFIIILIPYSLVNYLQTKNYREPVSYWEKAVSESPDDPMRHFSLSITYGNRGMVAEAGNELRKAIELDSTNYDYFNNLGMLFLQTNQLDSAIYYFEHSKKIDDSRPDANVNLAAAYSNYGNFKKAIPLLQSAQQMLDTINIDIVYNLYYAWSQIGDFDSCYQYVDFLLKNDPQFDLKEFYLNWEAKFYEQRNYDKAIEITQEMTRKFPSDAQAFNNLGYILMSVGRYQEAEIALLEALRLEPTKKLAYSNLYELYFKQMKNMDKAQALLKKYSSIFGENIQ